MTDISNNNIYGKYYMTYILNNKSYEYFCSIINRTFIVVNSIEYIITNLTIIH